MLPIFLACLAVVFVGNTYWCWRLNNWDELGEKRLKEKVFAINCTWSQRGKRDYSIFPSIELEISLWGDCISGAVGEVWVSLQTTCCSRRHRPRVSSGCLLELQSGTH